MQHLKVSMYEFYNLSFFLLVSIKIVVYSNPLKVKACELSNFSLLME